ncbi:hypothetical protein WMF38_29525 [Sorangium sp. So ce118]
MVVFIRVSASSVLVTAPGGASGALDGAGTPLAPDGAAIVGDLGTEAAAGSAPPHEMTGGARRVSASKAAHG